jgi:serine palmitoyltransferase
MGTQEAISYSDGASALSSAIPAFSKKGDLLLVDEAVNEPILTGLNLSRSTVQFFKHNDVANLRAILESIAKDDVKKRRDASQQRRFIVIEGLYRNTGDICPLPEILALKEEFCYRVILDESLSFGTLGTATAYALINFEMKTNLGSCMIRYIHQAQQAVASRSITA